MQASLGTISILNVYRIKLDMTDIYFESIEERPDIFPSKWHCRRLRRGDVECKTGNINPSSQLTTKSRLNSSYWEKNLLMKLMESYNDAWNFSDEMIICVWDVNQREKEPPLGFISFSFLWEQTKTKRISYLDFTVKLIWVRPDERGLGGVVARHVVSHLLFYLEDCKLIVPYVPKEGVDVDYDADWYSSGGEKLSYIIEDYLTFMKDNGVWKIRELTCDGSY
jgi:hypothetical protein